MVNDMDIKTKLENARKNINQALIGLEQEEESDAARELGIQACDTLEAAKKELEVENKQLLELSENLNEHPEGYNGPCLCQLCKSYG